MFSLPPTVQNIFIPYLYSFFASMIKRYSKMIDKAVLAGKTINGLVYLFPKFTGKLLLNLFCRPNEGKIFTKKEKAFLDQSKWEDLYLNQKKIQCYVWGKGEKKILLAHGFNSNASRWRLLVNLLVVNNYQVIALDVPAHGNSDWKRVNGLLYAQVIEVVMQHFQPQHVVGHSFAGIAYAYYFSKMDALPVEKMVLMGVPDELMEVTNVFFQTLAINDKGQTAYLNAFEEKFGYPTKYFTLSNFLKEVPYPTLIIHDKNDEIASFAGAQKIQQSMQKAQFFPTKNLGHSLQGRAVYKEILNFIVTD